MDDNEKNIDLIKNGKRSDGRRLDDSRQIKVNVNAIKTANSSSLVKIGHTSVVCGCTPRILTINEKDTNEKFEPLKIKVELPPICMNPTGPKTHHTEPILTRTLENILRDSGCIRPEELLIGDGDRYWSIEIEVVCLNYDGSLIDASLIAILSSLQTLRLTSSDVQIVETKIKLYSIPLSMTFAAIDDLIICDPTLVEEYVAQSTFSIAIDGETERLCHINKAGGRPISALTLSDSIERAKKEKGRFEQVKRIQLN